MKLVPASPEEIARRVPVEKAEKPKRKPGRPRKTPEPEKGED